MIEWLSAWYNWLFLLSFLVGSGLVALTLLGGGKDVEGGVDLEGHLHLGKDMDLAKEMGKDAHHPIFGVLAFLGVGKAPLTILLEVFLLSFGLLGLLVNAVGRDLLGGWGGALFPAALVVAGLGASAITRGVAYLFNRIAPGDGPTSRRSGEFIRQTGTTISSITHIIGQVRVDVEEKNAPSAIVNACVDPEYGRDIPRGEEVLLTGYDPARMLYLVRPLDLN